LKVNPCIELYLREVNLRCYCDDCIILSSNDLLSANENGIYCQKGDFYIDPWKPVKTAVITHAHSDHLRPNNQNYIMSNKSEQLSRHRLRESAQFNLTSYDYDETFEINGVTVSLHPAGHVLGSAQVRIETKGEVWVVSGDYKRTNDPSCKPFVSISCDVFVTEATFALPIYRWEEEGVVTKQIYDWWQRNAEENKPSVLFGYALGKTQRIMAELSKMTNESIYIHGALDKLTEIYRHEGITLTNTELVSEQKKGKSYSEDLIFGPPSAHRSPWLNRFKQSETAFASGWMRVRGSRRMGGYDKGFVLSDHADWPGLLKTIKETNANRIFVAYGKSDLLVRYLMEEWGLETENLETQISDIGE